jgi:5-methylthioribose kinase
MGILNDLGVDENRLTGIVKKHDESMKWMYENMEDLQKSYASKFIAIYNKKIVGSDPKKTELFNTLKQKYTDDEFEEIYIDFINPKGYILIL